MSAFGVELDVGIRSERAFPFETERSKGGRKRELLEIIWTLLTLSRVRRVFALLFEKGKGKKNNRKKIHGEINRSPASAELRGIFCFLFDCLSFFFLSLQKGNIWGIFQQFFLFFLF